MRLEPDRGIEASTATYPAPEDAGAEAFCIAGAVRVTFLLGAGLGAEAAAGGSAGSMLAVVGSVRAMTTGFVGAAASVCLGAVSAGAGAATLAAGAFTIAGADGEG